MNRKRFPMIAAAVLILLGVLYYLGVRQTGSGSGAPLAKVTVPNLAGTAKEGETLFNANCATCHGKDAAGKDGVAPPLVHIVYEPNHHGDQAFYLAARNGVRQHHWPFGNMKPVPGVTEESVTKIIAYVRALQRANGIR